MNNSNERIDKIENLIESNARAIQALSDNITTSAEITQSSINGLVQIVTEFSIRTESRLNKLDEAIVAISTTNQNLERLLEQLIRH